VLLRWVAKNWSVTSSESSRVRGRSTSIHRTARQSAPQVRQLRAPPRRPRLRQPAAARKAERANMGKKSRERALSDNEAKAVARLLPVSPQNPNLAPQLIPRTHA